MLISFGNGGGETGYTLSCLIFPAWTSSYMCPVLTHPVRTNLLRAGPSITVAKLIAYMLCITKLLHLVPLWPDLFMLYDYGL